MLTEALLREVVERMGKEFNDAASNYLEYPASERHLALMARANKDLENEQLDYDSLIDGNPNPSLRDQEYMQHRYMLFHFLLVFFLIFIPAGLRVPQLPFTAR